MADKKPHISEEDAALFRSQVEGATPMSSDRVVHEKPKPTIRKASRQSNVEQTQYNQALDDNFDLSPTDANSKLFFSHPGLQRKETKRLKRGEFGIDARLDLHGLTTTQAKQILLNFINSSQLAEKRCVLLIHGRGLGAGTGKAVLKSAVNHWLPQIPAVMAFSSALPSEGGLGAVYILLRRAR